MGLNKYLFMDIDGVLNHEDWFKTPGNKEMELPYCWFDPECVKRVNEIIEKTNCILVVTSDHRLDIRLEKWFKDVGLPTNFECTPVYWNETREFEIEQWLKNYAVCPYTYAIVDDMMVTDKNVFCRTANDRWDQDIIRHNGGMGLTETVKNRLIKILNHDEIESNN